MAIALFNDTGWFPHVGCRAVSSGLDRLIERHGLTVAYRSRFGEWRKCGRGGPRGRTFAALRAVIESVDTVVVNGEGCIHHGQGRHLLEILRVAQEMGRDTVLVNAVLQDVEGDLCVLHRLTDCTVREAHSSAYLSRLGVPHRVVVDAMVEATWSDVPAVDLSGQVVVTDWHGSRADVGLASRAVLQAYGDRAVFYPLQDEGRADRWAHAVADFRAAALVVTGRFHGVCLAALAGVPFVAFGSNTWKVEGLLSTMPGSVTVADPRRVEAACEQAMAQPDQFARIGAWFWAQRPLTTVAGVRSCQEQAA